MAVYINADDYGMTPKTCRIIEDCAEHGSVNSVSLLPNGCLREAAEWVLRTSVRCAVHINLVEGHAVGKKEKLGLLVDSDGNMKHSFPGLLLLSLSPRKKQLEEQLYLEIKEQFSSVQKLLLGCHELGIDSHQHVHMIPLVFRTMVRVIEEEQLPVSYMRIPAEPLGIYLRHPGLWGTLRPANLVKVFLLNTLWRIDRRYLKRAGVCQEVFCGVMLSGKMDSKRVRAVYSDFRALAERKKCNLELAFHPGYMEERDVDASAYRVRFRQFYRSRNRRIEEETLYAAFLKEDALTVSEESKRGRT